MRGIIHRGRRGLLAGLRGLLFVLLGRADASEEEAQYRAAQMAAELMLLGYTQVLEEDAGFLQPGEKANYTFSLRAGVQYSVFAAGDEDINDIDIHLIDENGNLVARDEEVDSRPVVLITPQWNGPFSLLITNSSRAPGFYYTAIMY